MNNEPFIVDSRHGKILVTIEDRPFLNGIDLMEGYEPPSACEVSDRELALVLHDHGIAASAEAIEYSETIGFKPADACDDYELPPVRYTLFYWGSDISPDDRDWTRECGWSSYGGIYALGIGVCGEPIDNDSRWYTPYVNEIVTVYLGAKNQPETLDELDEMKEDMLAAAVNAYHDYC